MLAEPLPTHSEVFEGFLRSFADEYGNNSDKLPVLREEFPLGDDIPQYRRFLTDQQLQFMLEDIIFDMVFSALYSLREGKLVSAKPTKGDGLYWLDGPTAGQAFAPISSVRVRTKYDSSRLTLTLYINAPLDYLQNVLAALWKAGYKPVHEHWPGTWSVRIM